MRAAGIGAASSIAASRRSASTAIDAALAVLYPGVEPIHVAPEVAVAFGGSADGISAYPAWASPHDFQAAVGSEEFREIAKSGPPGSPALYEVVRSM